MDFDIKAKIAIGNYLLTPDQSYNLYHVSRSDGKPIAKELSGRWTDVTSFRRIHDAIETKAQSRDQ